MYGKLSRQENQTKVYKHMRCHDTRMLVGESFGLSVLDFAYCEKPVITWNGGLWHKQHLSYLGAIRDKVLVIRTRQLHCLKSSVSRPE